MPDNFTTNPTHLRKAVQGLGAECGVFPRVISSRDPEWTCYMDSDIWQGDIYIHSISEFFFAAHFLVPLCLAFVLGSVFGFSAAKRQAIHP